LLPRVSWQRQSADFVGSARTTSRNTCSRWTACTPLALRAAHGLVDHAQDRRMQAIDLLGEGSIGWVWKW